MKSLQLEKPHAIVVVGIQGSGKTFFAEKFSETFSAPYVDERRFSHLAANEKAVRQLTELFLSEIIKTNKTVVIESNASKTARIELLRKLKHAGYKPLLVWVQTDTNTALARARKATSITPDEYSRSIQKFTPPSDNEQPLVISGKHTFASQAKTVLKKLSIVNRPTTHLGERGTTPAQQRGNIIVR